VAARSPLSPTGSDDLGKKRVKERGRPKPVPSYTDPTAVEDIDGVPLGSEEMGRIPGASFSRSCVLALPGVPGRPLVRRATDFPMPQTGDLEDHNPSPEAAATILETVLGISSKDLEDPVGVWKERRNEFKCPLCLDILVRPVDVAGCGHLVCRSHVIDLYQFCGSTAGIRCPVCRKEDRVDDFNKITVDQDKWRLIQRAQFHSVRRKSTSPSRSLTPLKDRFNRKFLLDNDF
jgi:hypothetical protein